VQGVQDKIIFALHIDEEVKIGIFTGVKSELRKFNA
jgi:hypothetical protein